MRIPRKYIVFLLLLLPVLAQAQSASDQVYPSSSTALLLVDPYNDFISEGGKLWPAVKATAERANTVAHMVALAEAARANGIAVVYVPHHRHEGNDYAGWKFMTPSQRASERIQLFAKDSWGGEFHQALSPEDGDVIAAEHWLSSGFANTDLDFLLKQIGIDHVVIAGIRANTCVEATGRYAVELGYHTTLISDAIAAFSEAEMTATIETNFPAFAHGVLTTAEFVSRISNDSQR